LIQIYGNNFSRVLAFICALCVMLADWPASEK